MRTVLVITRYFYPVRNGLGDHTTRVVEMLKSGFDRVVVVCEHVPERDPSVLATDAVKIVEFSNLSETFKTVSDAIERYNPDTVLFQYVPHMWGRAGFAPLFCTIPIWLRVKHGKFVVTFLHELYFEWSKVPKRLALGICHRLQLALIGFTSRRLIVTNHRRHQALKRIWGQKVYRMSIGNVSSCIPNDSYYRPEQPYIVWFGTFSSEGQRLEKLVQAFNEAANEILDLRLVLVGGFDTNSPRIQQIKQMCVPNRLIVRGFVNEYELGALLSGSLANMLVVDSGPSGRRGVFGAYLRCARAVIAVNGWETDPELVHGENILLVQDGDTAALRDAIKSVCEDQSLRERLEKGSRILFESHYSDDVISKNLLVALQR